MQEIHAPFCIGEGEKASKFVRPTVQKCYSKKKTFLFAAGFFHCLYTVQERGGPGLTLFLTALQHSFIKLAEFLLVVVEWQILMMTQGLLCGHLSLEVLALEKALSKDTYYETEQAHLLLCKALSKRKARLQNVSRKQQQPSF